MMPTVIHAQTADLQTDFTYQGYLNNAGGAVNASCTFQFSLFDAAAAGNQIGTAQTLNAIPVINGAFSVQLDFGAGAFNGQDRFLQIAVQCPGDAALTTLFPRQPVTPAPYAGYALSVPWAGITGVPAGFADGVDNEGWALTGNAGTTPGTNFIGTTDNVALDFFVNNMRALRIEPTTIDDSPNMIGGYSVNAVTAGVFGATISGGGDSGFGGNLVTDDYGVIGGGTANQAGDDFGTTNDALFATVGGGFGNIAGGAVSTVGGGAVNFADGMGATVSGGLTNSASEEAATVGGGSGNEADGYGATVSGGCCNLAFGDYATVSGGTVNTAEGEASTVSGGDFNDALGDYATVSGGTVNTAEGEAATVSGGSGNIIFDDYGTIGGGGDNQAGTDDLISTTAMYATVGGGYNNIAEREAATVGGGYNNIAEGEAATVGGGNTNIASGDTATVSGGNINIASGDYSTVGGGVLNTADGSTATVSGGASNTASAILSTVSGGLYNTASGDYSTIAGGFSNIAAGDYSFVVGRQAKNTNVTHDGVFLFADSTAADFTSAALNEFAARATGGVRFVTAADGSTGATLAAGSGSWAILSDRNAKNNFELVNGRDVLDALAAIPITTWNYNTQEESIRHIGPVAQDFRAAFGVGENETTINTVDADGVALAAIQGLYEVVQEKDAQIATLEARLNALERQDNTMLYAAVILVMGVAGAFYMGQRRQRMTS